MLPKISPYFHHPFSPNCGIDREAVECFSLAIFVSFVGPALGDAAVRHLSGLFVVQPSLVFVQLDIKMATRMTNGGNP